VNTIFSLSSFPLLLVSLLFGAVALALGLGMLALSRARFAAIPQSVPVAPFFTAVTTVWALSLGFVAADLWNLRADAEKAASAERSSVSRLLGMSAPAALDAAALREALAAYSAAVRDAEWGGNANAAPSQAVEDALQDMRLALIALARQATPQPLMAKMAQDFDELQDARNERLAIGHGSVNAYKWYLVLMLTLLAMVAIASVHADRPPAGRTALSIFATAAVVSLWVLAMHANPYTGSASIAFAPPAAPATD
jgi:hypothetical protein